MFEHDDAFRRLASDLFNETTQQPEPKQSRNYVPSEGRPVHAERSDRFEREWARNFLRDGDDTHDYL